MSRAVVNIIHSCQSQEIHTITKANHQRFADYCNADYLILECLETPVASHYRYLANLAASRYCQTLYLDVNCVVFQWCPDVFLEVPPDHWGLVDVLGLSRFIDLESDISQRMANLLCDSLFWPYIYLNRKLCTSVMLLPPQSAEYFFPIDKDGLVFDETRVDIWLSMNLQLHELPYRELDRRFNWNWSHQRFYDDLDKAFIVNLSSMPDRMQLLKKLVSENARL